MGLLIAVVIAAVILAGSIALKQHYGVCMICQHQHDITDHIGAPAE